MRTVALAAVLALLPAAARAVAEDGTVCTIPKGTPVKIRLAIPISSSKSATGEIFGFSLVDDIDAKGCIVKAEGAEGLGTVFLAGASGSSGHEGDLTLRLDYVRTFDKHYVVFDDQRMRINGKNRKIESAVLGFVPFAGYAAGLIRGSDVHLDPGTPINTVLDRDAVFTRIMPAFQPENRTTAVPSPVPDASSSPQAAPVGPQPSL